MVGHTGASGWRTECMGAASSAGVTAALTRASIAKTRSMATVSLGGRMGVSTKVNGKRGSSTALAPTPRLAARRGLANGTKGDELGGSATTEQLGLWQWWCLLTVSECFLEQP